MSRRTASGLCSAPMRHLDYPMYMVMSSMRSMSAMRRKGAHARSSRHRSCGFRSLIHRWRQAHPTSCTRMPRTRSRTSRMWGRSSPAICVQRSLSIPQRRRRLSVIWRHWLCLPSVRLTMVPLTLRVCARQRRVRSAT